jgi:hypothetical protein
MSLVALQRFSCIAFGETPISSARLAEVGVSQTVLPFPVATFSLCDPLLSVTVAH